MIVDKDGKEIPQVSQQQRHKFGEFVLPPDVRLVMREGIYADKEYNWTGTSGYGHKEHSKLRT